MQRRFVFLIAWISVCSPSALAHAYERSRTLDGGHTVRWPSTAVRMELAVSTSPQQLSAADLSKAVQDAASAWSAPAIDCTAVRIAVEPANQAREAAERDGVSRIVFHSGEWCRSGQWHSGGCYDHRIAAVTTLYFGDEPDARGEIAIVEADIELNAVDFGWSVGPRSGERRELDVRAVLAHEFGHVLGFAHVCDGWAVDASVRSSKRVCPSTAASLMVPSADSGVISTNPAYRPFPDDKLGVCSVYPGRKRTRGLLPSCTTLDSGARPPNALWIAGVLATLQSIRRRRRQPGGGQ